MKKATGRWLWNLEPLFFTLSLANFRAGPPGIPLRRQEEPSLLSFGGQGGYLVWEFIPKMAAPVKPELYPFSDRGCLLNLRRLNRFSSRAGLRITEPSGWRSCSRGWPWRQGLLSYKFQQVQVCPDDASQCHGAFACGSSLASGSMTLRPAARACRISRRSKV